MVELTVAMHRVFETPKDKFVWDVSHQSYVHKLLTGRKDRFRTIRTTDGLNGFSLRTESEHDCYGAGHAGTALSAALGMAAARDQRGDENVVCVFGDAALTNGCSFEALNNIAHTTNKFIGILNDNEWSIAKNVGAISNYLNKLITNPSYNKIAHDLQHFLEKIPTGKLAVRLGLKGQEAIKGTVTQVALKHNEDTLDADGRGGFGSSLIFEEFGIRYLRSDRRTRPAPADRDARVRQELRAANRPARDHQEGQGLQRRTETSREISRHRPIQSQVR